MAPKRKVKKTVKKVVNPSKEKNKEPAACYRDHTDGFGPGLFAGFLGMLIVGGTALWGIKDKDTVISNLEQTVSSQSVSLSEKNSYIARLEETYHPNVRYGAVNWGIGKKPEELSIKLSTQRMNGPIDLRDLARYGDNLPNAGFIHNFFTAAKMSGLDKYLPENMEKIMVTNPASGMGLEISKGRLIQTIYGVPTGDSKAIDSETLGKMWQIYKKAKKEQR